MARILIIDDDKAVLDAMVFVLRAYGYATVAAAEGATGIAALDAEPFDLVIVDRYMPNMDGLEVVRSIRAKWPALPIIAMSGSIKDDAFAVLNTMSAGPEHGAIRNVPKPLKPDQLISTIESLLSAQSGGR